MSPTYEQERRFLQYIGPHADALLAQHFSGVETISEPFCFEVELLSTPEIQINVNSLVGERASISLELDPPGSSRFFNGIITSFETEGGNPDFICYKLHLGPSLWLLTLNTQTRSFTNKNVLDIVQDVLHSYSIIPTLDTHSSYVSMEYCTQYRETDLSFVNRLLRQHGVFYYFEHDKNSHRMILSDDAAKLLPCPLQKSYTFQSGSPLAAAATGSVIMKFAAKYQLVPGRYKSWDYRFMPRERSDTTSRATVMMGQNEHQFHDYADSASAPMKTEKGDGSIRDLQKDLLTVQRESTEALAVQCHGTSTGKTLQAGFTFTLSRHPDATLNQKYIITQVLHQASQYPSYRSEDLEGEIAYQNSFSARPSGQPFRSAPQLPKPRVDGVVSGVVVAPNDDAGQVDQYGRVCVRFWWDDPDRLPSSGNTTVRARVSQTWAGGGYGTYFWPRLHDEVVIDFFEGDPDAPVIVGAVYNGKSRPPYSLPTHETRSGVYSRTWPSGSAERTSELRFEDKSGAEQIFFKAGRDMDQRTTNDHRRWVGGDDFSKHEGGRYEQIGKDLEQSVTGRWIENVSKEVSIRAGQDLILASDSGISIQVGESFVSLTPTGIAISGPVVRINSGGIFTSPLQPSRQVDTADDGTKGGKM